MKNICDWNNCKEIGEYKAPVEKDNSKKYRMLCLEHVKEFNKNWNYFSGMNDNQIIDFLKSDMTWHKPTQSFSSSDNFFKILWNNTLRDELDKDKLKNRIVIEKIEIQDKSFLHKNHATHQKGKFHLKLIISSDELKKLNKIQSNKKIYKVLDEEMKEYIHSLQILIS